MKILRTALVVTMVLASACSSAPSESTSDAPTSVAFGGPKFSVVIVTTDLGVGTNRVAFGLMDREGMPIRPAEAQVTASLLDAETKTSEVRSTSVAHFQQWPRGTQGVLTTQLFLDKPGFWQLNVEATTVDGSAVEATGAFQVKTNSDTPTVGQPAPRSATLTLDSLEDPSDLTTISSATTPDPDLYRMSVDAALDTGRPLILVFSTPAFCISATCGPQVALISEIKEKYQARVNFIHVEVFENPHLIEGGRPMGDTVAAVNEWNLPSEPWTFIIDGDGLVRAKFEQFTTKEEIETALLDLLDSAY